MNVEFGRQLDALPAMAWAAGPDGRCDFINRRWSEYTGDGPGSDWLAAVSADDQSRVDAEWRSIVASRKRGEMEARLRLASGEARWFRIECNPAEDESGRIARWYGTATDVDDLRRAREALARRQVEFQLIVDSISVPVAVTTPSGEVEGLNRATLDYFGMTLTDLKGWKASDVVHPDDLERTIAAQVVAHQTGTSYNVESRHRRADGVYRWHNVRGFPLRDSEGRILRWLHLLIDIDDRVRTNEALAISERNLKLTIETIPTMVWSEGPSGGTLSFNQHFLDFLGYTPEQAAGKEWTALIYPDDLPKLTAAWQTMRDTATGVVTEARVRRHDGEYRWLLFRTGPLRDENGDITKWYGVSTDIEDRKRAEDALRVSERNLKLTVDSILAVLWCARPDGSADFFNKAFLTFTGFTREQVDGWGWTAAVHPDDLPGLVAVWQSLLASSEAGEAEARIKRHDGEYRWFLFRANPLLDERGGVIKWYGVNVDIEDRKRAEFALQEQEREARLIVDTLPGYVTTLAPDGTILEINRQLAAYSGRTVDDLNGWRTNGTVHPEDAPSVVTTFSRAMETGEPYEFECRSRRFDGVYRWFHARGLPLRDQQGRVIRWYELLSDVNDRKEAEMELRRAYNSFADAQRLSHTGSFITDLVGDDHNWSEETYRIFQFEPGSKVSLERIQAIVHPDDLQAFGAMVARAMTGVDGQFLFRIIAPDGAIKHIRGLAHVVEEVAGHPLFVGALQDVTDTKVAEEALNRVRSELAHVARVTALSTLTASIAHEVNQPLSGIITNANTCLRNLAADPPDIEGARETAKRTIRDGNRAAEIIKRLRGLFGNRPFAAEAVDLNEAAREVISLSSSELQRNRIAIEAEFGEDVAPVPGDRVQLQQVILNLLLNASDAMKDVVDRPRQILIRTDLDEEGNVRVSVRDSGVGLPAEGAQRIFEPFYTTKADGMGIGLSVSRSIIERHCGRMSAGSHEGPGATFSFSIPTKTNQLGPQGTEDAR